MTTSPMPYIKGDKIQRVLNISFDPQREWTITRPDGQPDNETITFEDNTQYRRTFTYDGSGFLTKISQWVNL